MPVPPEFRRIPNVDIRETTEGALVDLRRLQELEALNIGALQQLHALRDELLRRALIIAARLPRTTTLAQLKQMGKRGLRQRDVELVYHRHVDPTRQVVVVYRHEQGRRRPLFWVRTPLATMTPGGAVWWRRGPTDNPSTVIRVAYGGHPEILHHVRAAWPHKEERNV